MYIVKLKINLNMDIYLYKLIYSVVKIGKVKVVYIVFYVI